MCEKCELKTVSITEASLNRSFLKSDSMMQYKHSMGAIVKANINAANHKKPYRIQLNNNIIASKKYLRQQGHNFAKTRAIAHKPENAGRIPTTLLDARPICDYLLFLTNVQNNSRVIEPHYLHATRMMRDNSWTEIQPHHLMTNPRMEVHHAGNLIAPLHMLHISTEDEKRVAYYPSLRHAREGREVRTKLGKYLTKYMGMYALSESEIKSMTEKHTANINARGGWSVEFVESNDPQGWERVYDMRGVNTCMQHESAVRIYANDQSHLRLAHILDGDDLVARCIVRDDPHGDKTGWLRVYPDPNGYAEGRFMLDWLNANGYPDRTNLDGCLLSAVENDDGVYECPYIDTGDCGDQTVSTTYINSSEYLRVGGGDMNATNTDGTVENNRCTCANCGSSFDEDELFYVDCDEVSVCDECRSDIYVHAYGDNRYEEWLRKEDCVEVNGSWYATENISNHDIYFCEYTNEYMHEDDMTNTDDGLICSYYATRLDHEHEGYDFAYDGDVVELSDGTTCHKDDRDVLQEEIDEAEAEEADSPTNVGTGEL